MNNEGSRLFDPALIARRRLRRWALIAVAVLLFLRLVAEVTPVLRRPDLMLLDTWQSLRGHHPSPQVVIVGVDEKSIARFGPPAWPRSQYVPLIERLAKAGAKVIGFDFTGALERGRRTPGLRRGQRRRERSFGYGSGTWATLLLLVGPLRRRCRRARSPA
jgi:CHASE2 domain-containing sensor protein